MSDRIPFDSGLRMILESALCGLHTAFPAQVESFNAATLRVDLQPCIKSGYKGIDASNWPIMSEVPVLYISSGDFHIAFRPKPKSYGLCIVCEKSLDEWLLTEKISEPSDNRHHDLSDAIFIPGLFPMISAALLIPPVAADCMEIRNSLNTVAIKLSATGIDITGNVTVDGVSLVNVVPGVPGVTVGAATHTHSCPSGGGTSGPPMPGT